MAYFKYRQTSVTVNKRAKYLFKGVMKQKKLKINAKELLILHTQKNALLFAFTLVHVCVPEPVCALFSHHPMAHKPELYSIKGSSHNKPIP